MESINVLRDEVKLLRAFFQAHQRMMGLIRFLRGKYLPPPVVPFPNQLRVPLKGFRRCKIFCAEVFPEAVYATKRGDSAVGGDPGPGEYCDTAC